MSAPTGRDEERELVARITSERDRRAQREDDAHAQRAAESHAQREDDALVDELAAMLRGAEPEVLSALQTDALIARATRRARIAPWVMPTLAMAAALLLAVAGGWWLHGGTVHGGTLVPAPQSTTDSAVANRDEPLRATLPTGDRVAATPGAELQFVSLSRAQRRIAVRRGEVLFDVLPLATGERFEVHLPHAIVRVRGTVFSVRTENDHAEVRVYEGQVDVERDDGSHALLGAGEMLRSDRSDTSVATAGALDVQGRAAAAVRIERARTARAEAARATPPVEAPAQPQDAGAAQATNVAAAGVEQPRGAAAQATNGADSERTRAQPAVTPPSAPALSLDATRALLAAGDFAGALSAARSGAARARRPAPWWLLEADALRGLGRAEMAADTYDRAAAALSLSEAAQAGFAAAAVRFGTLGDDTGTLRSLDLAHVDGPGSPLDERALGLRARALHRAGRLDEARTVARDYLTRHPSGGLVSWMQALLDSAAQAR